MAELADAADSKSADRKVVGVRPPLPAPLQHIENEWVTKTKASQPERLFHARNRLVPVLVPVGSSFAIVGIREVPADA
jgi:hypothetical protein